MNVETANRLVMLRKEMGLSQEELAERIGVSRQAVSKWERAESSPDLDNMVLLAKLYNISLDGLLLSESFDMPDISRVPKPFEESPAADSEAERIEEIVEEEVPVGAAPIDEMVERFSQKVDSFAEQQAAKIELYADNISRKVEDSLSGAFELKLENELKFDHDSDEGNASKSDAFYSENFNENIDSGEGEQAEYAYFEESGRGNEKIKVNKSAFMKALDGAYPVLVVMAYLVLGMVFRWWHPMWILFLTIPLYYTMMPGIRRIKAIQSGEREGNVLVQVKKMLDASYPLLVTFFFALNGALLNFWHPTWMLFLTIPLYYILMPAIVKSQE